MTPNPRRHVAVRRIEGLALSTVLLVAGCGQTPPRSPSAAPQSAPPVAEPSTSTTAVATDRSTLPSSSGEAPPVKLFGSVATAPLDDPQVAAFQATLDAAVSGGAPDAIAAVVTGNGTWSGAAGVGGPNGRKATANDEFAIGGVGIVFVAALVMRLAERGLIKLDAPIDDYMGDVVLDTNGATVRQALAQRTGIPDIGSEVAEAIAADPAHAWTLEDTLAVLPNPAGPPGPYVPALSNYVMLVLAVEHVTGTPLEQALRSELLDPVGAERILKQGAGVPTPKPWALPTEAHLGRFNLADLGAGDAISCIASATASYGVGGFAADAPSLAAWAWHLFAGDIVDGTTLSLMLPGADRHGLGLEVLGAPLDRAIGLTGAKTGYGSVLAIVPEDQIVAVVFVNDEEFGIDSFVADLIDAATDR